MRTITRGCAFDDTTKEWAVWMNKPKDLNISNMKLYYNGNQECYLQNYTNKKGVAMLVLRGKLNSNVINLNGFFIQMRKDLQTFIEKKKKEQQ